MMEDKVTFNQADFNYLYREVAEKAAWAAPYGILKNTEVRDAVVLLIQTQIDLKLKNHYLALRQPYEKITSIAYADAASWLSNTLQETIKQVLAEDAEKNAVGFKKELDYTTAYNTIVKAVQNVTRPYVFSKIRKNLSEEQGASENTTHHLSRLAQTLDLPSLTTPDHAKGGSPDAQQERTENLYAVLGLKKAEGTGWSIAANSDIRDPRKK